MNLLYKFLINLTVLFLPVIAVFNKKIKRFLENRKYVFYNISKTQNTLPYDFPLKHNLYIVDRNVQLLDLSKLFLI